jgi:hypothetical protein
VIILTLEPPFKSTFYKVPLPMLTSKMGIYLSRSMAAASIASTEGEDGSFTLPLANSPFVVDNKSGTGLN